MLSLQRITQQKMETEPYQWAHIDQLFSMEDAAHLATSFPRDKFKKVKGYDGEKGYEYMSRSWCTWERKLFRTLRVWTRHGWRWLAISFRRNTAPR